MAAIESPDPVTAKSMKKQKKEKSDKKRAREEDAATESERRHKKSKSVSGDLLQAADDNDDIINDADETTGKKEKKKVKKEKKEKKNIKAEDDDTDEDAKTPKTKQKKQKQKDRGVNGDSEMGSETKVKTRKPVDTTTDIISKDDSDDSSDDAQQIASQLASTSSFQEADDMEVDGEEKPIASVSSNIYQPSDIPSNPQFPFFSQTVSLYEPIFPVGWAQPVTNAEYQYLRHLQNRYVPSLRGVLMSYKNVTLGPNPGRNGAAKDDEDPTTLMSNCEYAVGYGWITADVELFVPGRGAWMEGSVNLQTEGHIGVVCYGKFNASIEARRLPPSWSWVSNEDPDAEGMEENASIIAPDEHGVVRQIHSTGFWTDENGDKIKGKIRFRIRNFDVGISGETTYLSLEGTMLDKTAEKLLVHEEAAAIKARRNNRNNRSMYRKRAPDFSTTRFMSEGEEQRQRERREQQEAEDAAVETIAPVGEGTKIVFDD